MTADLPPPARHCPACAGGLYGAVPFCPFCGTGQDRPDADPPAPPTTTVPMAAPVAALHPEPASSPEPAARAPSPVPAVAPRPAPPPQQLPRPQPSAPLWRRAARPRRAKPGLRQIVLAAAAIAGLAALASMRRDGTGAPTRIGVGPAWTAVALAPFRAAPLLRLTGDGPFSLRLDGERVLRVAPENGAAVRPSTLRSLELRAGRGRVTVTLTPRGR